MIPLEGSPGSPLRAMLGARVRASADRTAVVSLSEDRSVSFAELDARIHAWENALHAAAVGEGRTVLLAVGNVCAFPELFFALRGFDAAVLAADSGLHADGLRAVAARMGASLILHRSPGIEGTALDGSPDPNVRLLPTGKGRAAPEATALIKLTSGSTLAPRGACFTEDALVDGIEHIRRGMSLSDADRVLLTIPLSHSYGFDNGVLSLAAVGTPLVLQPDPLPGAILSAMERHDITFLPSVPPVLRALSRIAWPKGLPLRKVVSASAPLSAGDARAFREASGLPVHQFYGATECGGISFETDPDHAEAFGTVGAPLPGVDVNLDDAGNVRVESPANRFAILPEDGPCGEAVLTGDRGEFTASGRLRLLGRTGNVANVGGFKLNLGEIDAFLRSLPGVSEAVSLAVDDAARGQRVVAWVESATTTSESVLKTCRERLSAREVPGEVRVLAELPRNGRGKPDRAALSGRAAREA